LFYTLGTLGSKKQILTDDKGRAGKNMNQARWKSNAQSFLVMHTILAATAGIFIIYMMSDPIHFSGWSWLWPILPLAFATFLFIVSGEGVSDALDEDDVLNYVYFFIPYNIGVILLVAGIYSTIYVRYSLNDFILPGCRFLSFCKYFAYQCPV
jgi:hypothetical protein